jgi:ketosteroid isomerase-like protein
MQRDIENVEAIYEAFGRRNLPALLRCLGKDIEIIQSAELPWGGIYLGHAGVQEYFTALQTHLDSRIEMERLIDAGDHVVAVGRTTGKARSTGLEFDVPLVHVWRFRDGRVSRFEAYTDNATMLGALGISCP